MTTKISALPTLAAVTDATLIPVVEGGATKKITGVTLKNYALGAQGVTGSQGTTGTQGTTGSTGAQGTSGAQGTTGSGSTGAQGSTGSTGTQGITGSFVQRPTSVWLRWNECIPTAIITIANSGIVFAEWSTTTCVYTTHCIVAGAQTSLSRTEFSVMLFPIQGGISFIFSNDDFCYNIVFI